MSSELLIHNRRRSSLSLFPIPENSDQEPQMRVPSTPEHSETYLSLGKRVGSPTMDPETRKSARPSPKVSSHSRKGLTSPTNVQQLTIKRSGVKSSDFRGVSKCAKDGRWQSRIRVGKKVKYLGRFKTEEEAAARYDEAALALHGRRATLNFELSDGELEKALTRINEKRVEFGFDDSDLSESYSPRPSVSRTSSRSTSPSQGFEEEYEEEDPTADDQNAAMSLLWLKLNLNASSPMS